MSIDSLFSTISLLAKLPSLFSSRRNPQPIENGQNNQVGPPIQTLPDELLLKIFKLLPLQALGRVSQVCRQWCTMGSDKSLWNALLKKEPNVRNLDKEDLKSIGFPQVSTPTVHPRELLKVAKIACKASENGCSTIVTLPAGWSWDDLVKLSQKAIDEGIPSARIDATDHWKELLRKTPIKKEQTVVLTDTVIKDSRNKSVGEQKGCLKAKGFEEGFPDALTVLTIIVLTRIITNGQTTLYNQTYTRFSYRTPRGSQLLGGSAPSEMCVISLDIGHYDNVGVGGLRKFSEPKQSWLSYFFG